MLSPATVLENVDEDVEVDVNTVTPVPAFCSRYALRLFRGTSNDFWPLQ